MKIGQRVKIVQMRDPLSAKAKAKVGQVGTVKDYKMTDGSGVGVVVEFDDRTSCWFFEDELEASNGNRKRP